jgi:hypothetical protein
LIIVSTDGTANTNEYKLVDLNPRVGAQFRLFEDGAGVDVARALYLDLTGRCVRASRPIEGRTFVVDFHDLAASLGYLRRGALTFLDWRRPSRLTRGFLLLPAPLFCQDWVVYCKPPFGGPEHVLHYVRTVVWQGVGG